MTKRFQPILLIAILSFGFGGCKSDPNKVATRSKQRINVDDTTFAAGAARPPSAATSYGLSKILVGQGRDRDALYLLTRLRREHPTFLPAYNEVAGIYVRSDRLDDAIAILEVGLKQSPDDGVLHNNLGMCHFLKGDHEQALESFTRATDKSPTNPLYRANRAAALAMLGRDVEARTDYYSVLDITATKRNLAILARARGEHAATTRPTDASAESQ